ncbi:hypothetical protein Poli38472_012190 [Pythium oligandrum]|uniref:Cytochrome P450 n=1 Tax=Pythium oligandrum TaxID=41045 RepID=A0A8K1CP72_PYTOL|nr:hypothetical protein Poli38472_012190 [Pythium oligandrum]|eukprot:TMW67074.1 hypothetical protein Poli38472_012190 [Pythium oligandrum]
MEAFAEMGFGIQMNRLEVEDEHPLQRAFDSAQRMIILRYQHPPFVWKLQKVLGIGAEAQLMEDVKVIDDTVLGIILKTLSNYQTEATSGTPTLVSIFLEQARKDGETDIDPSYLRDIVLRDEIVTLLPDLEDGVPTMEQVQQLTYMEAAIKESLRLYPSVPVMPKYVQEDTVLSDGTFLRKGWTVILPNYAFARLPHVWGPDAKEFNPERWIFSTTGKICPVSLFKFAPFNAGPRVCPGMNLAMLEMKIVLVSLLSRFHIDLVPGQDITNDNAATLPIKSEMLVRIKKSS